MMTKKAMAVCLLIETMKLLTDERNSEGMTGLTWVVLDLEEALLKTPQRALSGGKEPNP